MNNCRSVQSRDHGKEQDRDYDQTYSRAFHRLLHVWYYSLWKVVDCHDSDAGGVILAANNGGIVARGKSCDQG